MKLRKATAGDFELYRELNAEVQQLHADHQPLFFSQGFETFNHKMWIPVISGNA